MKNTKDIFVGENYLTVPNPRLTTVNKNLIKLHNT